MSASPILLNIVLIVSLVFVSPRPSFGQQTSKVKDLTDGIGEFLIERPRNPPVNRRHSQKTKGVESKEPLNTTGGMVAGVATALPSKPDSEDDDKTEDALFLGNAARDATPPRYEEAERAYKLATKLSPR